MSIDMSKDDISLEALPAAGVRGARAQLSSAGLYTIVILFLAFCLFPLVILFVSAFKTDAEIMRGALVVPHPTIANFENIFFVFGGGGIGKYLLNSVVVAVISTLVATILGATAAYGLSRFRFRLNSDISFFILSTRFAPPVAFIIPIYVISRTVGLLDTWALLIIIYAAMNLSLVVWVMLDFFNKIPIELEEAALVDGYGRVEIFYRVILPLVKPGLAASAMLSAIFAWNEFIFALMLTQRFANTVPVYLSMFSGALQLSWGPFMAVGAFAVVPVIIAAVIIQRLMRRSISFAAVK